MQTVGTLSPSVQYTSQQLQSFQLYKVRIGIRRLPTVLVKLWLVGKISFKRIVNGQYVVLSLLHLAKLLQRVPRSQF